MFIRFEKSIRSDLILNRVYFISKNFYLYVGSIKPISLPPPLNAAAVPKCQSGKPLGIFIIITDLSVLCSREELITIFAASYVNDCRS